MTRKKVSFNVPSRETRVVSVPAAISNRVGSSRGYPKGTHIEEGRIKIADLAGSITFTATKYQLNPGIAGTFGTRLANIASGYEKYCFLKDLRVEYVPSQAVTTTAGSVWLGFDYDPMDDVPLTDSDFSTYESWVSTNVFNKVDLAMMKTRSFDGVQHKKVRSGPVNGDLSLYDPGALIVATDDCVDASDLGKLYLHYSFVFISPQTATGRVPTTLAFSRLLLSQTVASGVPETVDFVTTVNGLQLGRSSSSFELPPGNYLVRTRVKFATTSALVTTYRIDHILNAVSLDHVTTTLIDTPPYLTLESYISIAASDGVGIFSPRATITGAGTLTLTSPGTTCAIQAI